MFLTTVAAQTAGSTAGGWQMLLPLALVFGVMYFLIIRPQNKRMRTQQEMQSSIKLNDTISTAGGLIGRVVKLEEKEVHVDFNKSGNAIRVLRTAIVSVLAPSEKARNLTKKQEENVKNPRTKQATRTKRTAPNSQNRASNSPQQRRPAGKKAEE